MHRAEQRRRSTPEPRIPEDAPCQSRSIEPAEVPRARCIEQLESRELLSSVFAHLNGSSLAPGGHETIALRLSHRDFTMPSGRALLGFAMSETGGSFGEDGDALRR